MVVSDWHEEPISKSHNRAEFDCGDDALNEFIHQHARKSHEKGGSKTFCAISNSTPNQILGFYSLSPASVEFARAPEIIKRGLAKYDIPLFRLGRLAVNTSQQGEGLGGQLLVAAAKRCYLAAQSVGGVGLLIDAKNIRVKQWYESYGAIGLVDTELSLIMHMATIEKALKEAGQI
ncbi:MAG: GNAT family N-acetyltransferase [Caulobacterales bacterium]|nr:GNAT family N-acetyltransferase [Caulobacterales bacterium]MCA0372244.1 GNAT family N-acetyltransferase [Pseudomonadota bacterium]